MGQTDGGGGDAWQPRESEWESQPPCHFTGHGGCEAGAVENGLCLRHMPEGRRKDAVNRTLAGRVVDLRGLQIDHGLWTDLVDGLEQVAFDAAEHRPIWFSGATFEVPAFFFGWRFYGNLNFDGTRFAQGANFYGAVFERNVSFVGAKFSAGVEDISDFRAKFSDLSAEFEDAVFKGGLELASAEFEEEARFYKARFHYEVDFRGASFAGLASFQETEWFAPQRLFGRISLGGDLNLRRASFDGDLLLEVEGGRVNFEDTRFGDALTIRARGTVLALEHLDLTRPALVALAPKSEADGGEATAVDFSPDPSEIALPKIRSLRDSNVLGLTIASASLRECLFQGVRNIDRLSIEGNVPFAEAPKGRSRRRTVYEESIWRLARADRAGTAFGRMAARLVAPGWLAVQASASDTAEVGVQPDQLARIYRGLRKSLEESKDYAGASDLYYGEMEMRLRARSTPPADRCIIALYWLLSGYGLRASRSLLALALLLAIFSFLFAAFGFVDDESMLDGFLHSARAAALFPQSDEIDLTQAGQVFQIALRVVGPALIGLSALALRARIKR
jgi:pentapeptide repeat protein